jgi:hypothetical protein
MSSHGHQFASHNVSHNLAATGRNTLTAHNQLAHNQFAHNQFAAQNFRGLNNFSKTGFNRNAFGNNANWNHWGGHFWGAGWNNWGWGWGCWAGPVFWPFLLGDVFSFVFWPYAYYDPFWFYGPPFIFASIFAPGPYFGPDYGYGADYYGYGYGAGDYGYAGSPNIRQLIRKRLSTISAQHRREQVMSSSHRARVRFRSRRLVASMPPSSDWMRPSKPCKLSARHLRSFTRR